MYTLYNNSVDISITQFRRDLFALVNLAMQGERLSITHKGRRFLIVPEDQPGSRFNRLTPLQIINPEFTDFDDSAMKEDMVKRWENDWANL